MNWDGLAAYVAPEKLPSDVTDSDQYKDGIESCAMAYPFIKSFKYAQGQVQSDRVYLGMKESAILCSIEDPHAYMTEPLKDPDYKCPAGEIPYIHDSAWWDDKFLSPVCSDWFIDQESTPQHTVVSNSHISAATLEDRSSLSLASCSPIFK